MRDLRSAELKIAEVTCECAKKVQAANLACAKANQEIVSLRMHREGWEEGERN